MKIEIRYRTDYHYEDEVSFSPHIFRLFPRVDPFVKLGSIRFETNEGADIQYRRDLFDNETAYCFYPRKGTHLVTTLAMELELREKNPFHFLLESHALNFPFQYKPEERRVLAPSMEPQAAGLSASLPFWKSAPGPTVETLIGLNGAIHGNIKYERRDEGVAREAAETLALGVGSCRDFTVLLAETLRANGVAARLVSGYLCEFGDEEKRAVGALHAWVEAYLPGAGWLGMDPTNGTLCSEFHISTAVGLVPPDIAPVTGNYFNKTRVESKMDATLEITPCPV